MALAQGHGANKWQSWDSTPNPWSPRVLKKGLAEQQSQAEGIPTLLIASQASLLSPPLAKNTQ